MPATPFHVYFESLMNNWPTPFRAAHNFGPFAVVVEILETLQHLSASKRYTVVVMFTPVLCKALRRNLTSFLIDLQTSSLTTFLSTTALQRIASAKYSLATVATLSWSIQTRAHLRKVISSEQQYFAVPRQC